MPKRVRLELVDCPWSVSVGLLPGLIAYGMGETLSKTEAREKYWPRIREDALTGKLSIRTALGSPATSSNFVFNGELLKSGTVRADVLKRYMWHRHRIRMATTVDDSMCQHSNRN